MKFEITEVLLRALNYTGDINVFNKIIPFNMINQELNDCLTTEEKYVISNRYPDDSSKIIPYNKMNISNKGTVLMIEEMAKNKICKKILDYNFFSNAIIFVDSEDFGIKLKRKEEFKEFLIKLNNKFRLKSYMEFVEAFKIIKSENVYNIIDDIKDAKAYLKIIDFYNYLYPKVCDKTKEITISELGFKKRTFNALEKVFGKNLTLNNLIYFVEGDFTCIRNMGPSSAKEVIDKVHNLGYKFFYENDEISRSLKIDNLEESMLKLNCLKKEKTELISSLEFEIKRIDKEIKIIKNEIEKRNQI